MQHNIDYTQALRQIGEGFVGKVILSSLFLLIRTEVYLLLGICILLVFDFFTGRSASKRSGSYPGLGGYLQKAIVNATWYWIFLISVIVLLNMMAQTWPSVLIGIPSAFGIVALTLSQRIMEHAPDDSPVGRLYAGLIRIGQMRSKAFRLLTSMASPAREGRVDGIEQNDGGMKPERPADK